MWGVAGTVSIDGLHPRLRAYFGAIPACVRAMGIRTETELILKSRWVVPERLSTAGFRFEYPDLEPALAQIVAECRASR